MFKRVEIADVELGMFVHKMEGSWFKHPFWKSRFQLDNPDTLSQLKASELESVIIDTTKSKSLKKPASSITDQPAETSLRSKYKEPEVRRPATRIAALSTRQSIDLQSTEPVSTELEIGTAQIVADKAQKAVSQAFIDARLGETLDLQLVEPVVKDIFASVRRNPQAFSGLMRCKQNNEFVYRHALAVSALMVSLARKMRLTPNQVREAGLAGMFLDIGTSYLPQDLALPNGDFRNADPEIWQQHVTRGVNALKSTGGIPQTVVEACLHHHERMDGGGFPHGIKGEEIGQIARMAAICDTFDYLLTDTTTSVALDPTAAIMTLKEMEGAFDPEILASFIEAVGIHPVGSFVKLHSNRLAMVIDQRQGELARPVVRTFYSLTSEQRIRPQTIELARNPAKDKIVGIADLSGLVLPEEGQLRELMFLGANMS